MLLSLLPPPPNGSSMTLSILPQPMLLYISGLISSYRIQLTPTEANCLGVKLLAGACTAVPLTELPQCPLHKHIILAYGATSPNPVPVTGRSPVGLGSVQLFRAASQPSCDIKFPRVTRDGSEPKLKCPAAGDSYSIHSILPYLFSH